MTNTLPTTARQPTTSEIDQVQAIARAVHANVAQSVLGKDDVIELAIAVLLAQGHLLLEDVPGIGKTTLAKALADAIDGSVGRIQFTPDLMPSDVTGVSVYRPDRGTFDFHPGPVFANIVVGDEINRASPKTQSALLEAMQERQVTVDHTTYLLPEPFMVIATQNPIEMAGTYPLPEAQRDRFSAQISIGYPDKQTEMAMLDRDERQGAGAPAISADDVVDAATVIRNVHVADGLKSYVVTLVGATREDPRVRLGASPRSAIHWVTLARARAAMDGRAYVLPDDIQDLAVAALAHRLVLTPDTTTSPAEMIADLIDRIPIPTGHA